MQFRQICPFLFILLFFVTTLTACSGEDDIPEERRLTLTQEELDEQEQEDSLSTSVSFSKSEFRGMTLFMQHCNKCHPGGGEGVGPSLIDKKVLPDMLIHFQVRAGLGEMPSFDQEVLSKNDVKKIISFIQLLRKEAGNG